MDKLIDNGWQDDFLGIDHQRIPAPSVKKTIRFLLRGIFSGDYSPGDRIREVELANGLNLSRAPVREAISILAQEGVLDVETWRGASVINPSPSDISNQFELLATIYGSVARFACRNASEKDLEPFFRSIRDYEESLINEKEIIDVIEITYRMGAQLGQCCGSPLAAELLRKLGRICYLQHRHLSPMPSRWKVQSMNRMRRLEQAVRDGLEEKADKAARRLVENSASLVMKRISTP